MHKVFNSSHNSLELSGSDLLLRESAHLDVLKVDFDEADLVRFRQKFDASDAAELCKGGQDAQLVVDHLTHAIARPHQQGHH